MGRNDCIFYLSLSLSLYIYIYIYIYIYNITSFASLSLQNIANFNGNLPFSYTIFYMGRFLYLLALLTKSFQTYSKKDTSSHQQVLIKPLLRYTGTLFVDDLLLAESRRRTFI